MNNLLLFVVQIGIPAILGISTTLYLRGVTYQLLVDICGTEERAEFWVRITAVLTVTPIVLVLIFGYAQNSSLDFLDYGYVIFRQTLWLSLIGVLGAVTVLARMIWKQIPQLQLGAARAIPSSTGES